MKNDCPAVDKEASFGLVFTQLDIICNRDTNVLLTLCVTEAVFLPVLIFNLLKTSGAFAGHFETK